MQPVTRYVLIASPHLTRTHARTHAHIHTPVQGGNAEYADTIKLAKEEYAKFLSVIYPIGVFVRASERACVRACALVWDADAWTAARHDALALPLTRVCVPPTERRPCPPPRRHRSQTLVPVSKLSR